MQNQVFGKPAKVSDIKHEELEIAQWRINTTNAGVFKVDEIYAEYWGDQDNKKGFGKIFKAAVVGGRLTGIRLYTENGREILSTDRQLQYVID